MLMNDVKLFALSNSAILGNKVAKELGVPLSKCKTQRFADGETMVEFLDSVRGKDVFLIQSTSNPVDISYMELFIAIDALKRASAKSINLIMPYYGYSRQDRKNGKNREPITAKMIADLLCCAGIDYLLTLDLHVIQIQGFYSIPVDNTSAIPLLANYFNKKELDNLVVISPDHNGLKKAKDLADLLHAPVAIIDKERKGPDIVEAKAIIGDIKNKNILIVDDIVDTGSTIIETSNLLKKEGVKDIYVACSHAVFSNNAEQKLHDSIIKEIVITDSINFSPKSDKIHIISISKLLADIIRRISKGKSISDYIQ